MLDRNDTPESHLAESADCERRGDRAGALRAARLVLERASEGQCPGGLEAEALVVAARSAYHLSMFDESSSYLDRYDELAPGPGAPRAILQLEAALVRANIMRRRGAYREALALLEVFDDPALPEASAEMAGERLLIEGACRYYLDDTRAALEAVETAMGLCRGDTHRRLRARVLAMSGLILLRLGFLRKAADDLKRGAALCEQDGDVYGAAAARLNLGIVQYREGRIEAAREAVERARLGFEKAGWRLGVCRCLIASGNIAARSGEMEEAVELYSSAAGMAKESGFLREEALARNGLGSVHLERQENEQAVDCLCAASAIASIIAPDGDLAGEVALRRAMIAFRAGDTERAAELLDLAASIFEKIGEVRDRGLVERMRGLMAFDAGEEAEGRNRFEKARSLLREAGCTFELAETCLLHAEALMSAAGRTSDVPDTERPRTISRLLVEARYLFSIFGAMHRVRRIDRHIARDGIRFPLSSEIAAKRSGNGYVEVRFSNDYRISEGFIGVSPLIWAVWKRMQLAASFGGPVCITGETGTGKELVARLIHTLGDRGSGPFVAVNCAAIPDHLFESEFFGHRKGCFTGALTDRRGFFEEADGGTLFLDEVGELSAQQQAKLLRVLQEGTVRRVGENTERRVDIKVVSATNRDLERGLEDSSMRSDFYFRVSAERIHIPPLRQRPEDVIPLIAWKYSGGNGHGPLRIETEALQRLQRYPWPGNVRELFAVVERIRRAVDGCPVETDHLSSLLGSADGSAHTSPDGPESARRRLERAMNACGGNKSAAARCLGISRGTLYKELRRTGLDRYFSARRGLSAG